MDDEDTRIFLHQQSQITEDQINQIKAGKHGPLTNVFKIRELIAGFKKTPQEAHVINISDSTKGLEGQSF